MNELKARDGSHGQRSCRGKVGLEFQELGSWPPDAFLSMVTALRTVTGAVRRAVEDVWCLWSRWKDFEGRVSMQTAAAGADLRLNLLGQSHSLSAYLVPWPSGLGREIYYAHSTDQEMAKNSHGDPDLSALVALDPCLARGLAAASSTSNPCDRDLQRRVAAETACARQGRGMRHLKGPSGPQNGQGVGRGRVWERPQEWSTHLKLASGFLHLLLGSHFFLAKFLPLK